MHEALEVKIKLNGGDNPLDGEIKLEVVADLVRREVTSTRSLEDL